jgi:hypothetical protein
MPFSSLGNARMELTHQEGPECDSSGTDGALYCDKCKQCPARLRTVSSQAQTTPALLLLQAANRARRPGAVRSRRDRAREGAVAPAVYSGVQGWYTLAAIGRIRRGNGGGLPLRRAGRSFL